MGIFQNKISCSNVAERERENREMQLLVPRRMRERETGGKEKHQTSAGTAGSRESSVTERHRKTERD